MSIQLDSITFNHDPGSADTDGLSLRVNADRFLPVPEWQKGVSVRAADSMAAYALEETRGKTITILVKLTNTDPRLRAAEIRAVPAGAPVPPVVWPYWSWGAYPYTYWSYWNYYTQLYLWQLSFLNALAAPPAESVLGSVKARQVNFSPNDPTVQEMFVLENPQLGKRSAGIHEVTWQWQYRAAPSLVWRNFALTRHKIFTVLAVPTRPWKQGPYHPANTQLPWTEVLEFACDWAFGTKTLDEAATRITENVYNLGRTSLRYGCETGGATQYTDFYFPYFYCSEFLERLRGELGRGHLVNCIDCATVVSTFSNILGCDLWQSQMGTGFQVFDLNPILAIGSDRWQTACGWEGFGMHEVAWKGGCTSDDEVFDACLEVDGGADPTRAPHTPLLPANMRFGRPNEGQYRDRLTAPRNNAREICEPQPETRRRRSVI
jgi:hypothetical protein